jgi:hypothetical protein
MAKAEAAGLQQLECGWVMVERGVREQVRVLCTAPRELTAKLSAVPLTMLLTTQRLLFARCSCGRRGCAVPALSTAWRDAAALSPVLELVDHHGMYRAH